MKSEKNYIKPSVETMDVEWNRMIAGSGGGEIETPGAPENPENPCKPGGGHHHKPWQKPGKPGGHWRPGKGRC